VIPLMTNQKVIQSVAQAFQMVADELEAITHDIDGQVFDSQVEHTVRHRLKNLEKTLQMHGLIRDKLPFELEVRGRVLVRVPPDELLSACIMQIFGL
jgi:hypothetical protein